MKNASFEIPYRLDTVEDIKKALNSNLLGMRSDYRNLMAWAEKATLHHPPALTQAKNKVTKEFVKIHEEKIKDVKISFHQVANLPLVDYYPLIIGAIPWVQKIACHENLFQYFHSLPVEIRERCLLVAIPDSPTGMYAAVLAIRKLLRREMVVYLKAQKTSMLSLTQLKQSLVALTIFAANNEDILSAMKTEKTDASVQIHQNAVAEILFARLPQTIRGLLAKEVGNLAQKLSSKMSKLNFTSRHIMNLMGYVKPNMTFDDLLIAMDRIDGVAMKISAPQESKDRLHDYIGSLKRNIQRAPLLYRTLFLTGELDKYQQLYRPTKVMCSEETVNTRTVNHFTRLSTLDFYPTKDYLDYLKGSISNDCTGTSLGEKHLLTPQFFNIRIFKNEDWIGNIYMLDFCQDQGALLIDRIQISRSLNVFYGQFFDYLRDMLIEMFNSVQYRYILMPLTISNHETIQKIFNEYRKGLSKKTKLHDSSYSMYFESLRGRKSYYVLYERPEER